MLNSAVHTLCKKYSDGKLPHELADTIQQLTEEIEQLANTIKDYCKASSAAQLLKVPEAFVHSTSAQEEVECVVCLVGGYFPKSIGASCGSN